MVAALGLPAGAPMTDLVFIVVTAAFFALAAAYVRGCARL
jgi:hypothetical protein